MGNRHNTMTSPAPEQPPQPQKSYEPAETFAFLGEFPDVTTNGLHLNDVYFPEEVITMILSYVPPKDLLRVSEVCKRWFNLIKSDSFWGSMYHRKYGKRPKKLPWYVYYTLFTTDYFDLNLLKNGNGQEGYKHWTVIVNYGDQFRIENPPTGSDPLPCDVPEFNGKGSCFATSYYECNKLQEIQFHKNRLMHLIFDRFKPHIYLSEWVAARFDCGCIYHLWVKLFGARGKIPTGRARTRERSLIFVDETSEESDVEDDSPSEDTGDSPSEDAGDQAIYVDEVTRTVEQWAGSTWEKVELIAKNYPVGVRSIVFQHEGRDTQFWKGHYGSKMAGGVVKILFDSIEPLT